MSQTPTPPPPLRSRPFRGWLGYGLALTLAGAAFFSGVRVGEQGLPGNWQLASIYSALFAATPEVTAVDERPDLSQFWTVWDMLEERFVLASTTDAITSEERLQGAIDGLVNAYGDPYTVFFPPQESEDFAADIAGEFSGVGMEVGVRDRLITIISPLPNTPAERAGLLAGDVIVSIDGASTEGMSIDEAVRLIRGERGTAVVFEIYREGATQLSEVTVVRDIIEIPTVDAERLEDAFVIRIYSFNAIAEREVREALSEYVATGRGPLVLDVRGNPGGYLESAVGIASYFLPTGKVIVREMFGSDRDDTVFRSRGRYVGEFSENNLVVLVDNGSASASEILAGALKAHNVATVIGVNTFGKGSVQELVPLEDGSSLKVTIARWVTPDGTSISDGGLAPDIRISRTPEQRLAGEDPQLAAARTFLRGEVVVGEEFLAEVGPTASSSEAVAP